MTEELHYVCTGGCDGVSNSAGVCQDETCPDFGKPLSECGCSDGSHENMKNDAIDDTNS